MPPTIDNSGGDFLAFHNKEIPWVGAGWGDAIAGGGYETAPECQQRCAIQTGALWKFLNQEKIYRCPTGDRQQLVTYTIIDSMNGKYKYSGCCASGTVPDPPIGMCNKTLGQIKNATQRIVFLDEGRLSPDSFAVNYNCAEWFDPPMVRHGNGTNASFADGHAARLMWKSDETIKYGKDGTYCEYDKPTTCEGKIDLYKMQVYCWGHVGPSYPFDSACKYAIDD